MKLTPSSVLSAIAGFVLLAGGVAAIDMQDVCHTQYSSDYTAVKDGDGCNDWKCLGPDGNRKGMNLNLYCYEQLGSGGYASCDRNAWGWSCKK
ncbi:hypothetical protein QBC47DRAFT_404154 [Echria macrotheca]|uniref:Secreted protein n=1 Tax=Echria macrotheca TaxID=438768 RepID=A0AAJ0B8U8_9PEZI|nr:hypothetical protein QBC47DRAFT_404154 [Echria macrotheca]